MWLIKHVPDLLKVTSTLFRNASLRSYSNLAQTSNDLMTAGGIFTVHVRNKIRCYFPRPSERKRIKRHGWNLRMSTLEGRRVLMRRMLKGRHVLSH